jgi:hypothetical protein
MECPDCGNDLQRVRQSEPKMYNSYQFDAVKAGDYFCDKCKSDKAMSGYKYFWKHELEEK